MFFTQLQFCNSLMSGVEICYVKFKPYVPGCSQSIVSDRRFAVKWTSRLRRLISWICFSRISHRWRPGKFQRQYYHSLPIAVLWTANKRSDLRLISLYNSKIEIELIAALGTGCRRGGVDVEMSPDFVTIFLSRVSRSLVFRRTCFRPSARSLI